MPYSTKRFNKPNYLQIKVNAQEGSLSVKRQQFDAEPFLLKHHQLIYLRVDDVLLHS
jgi:hypothetical protein